VVSLVVLVDVALGAQKSGVILLQLMPCLVARFIDIVCVVTLPKVKKDMFRFLGFCSTHGSPISMLFITDIIFYAVL
jgi:hypothetical protein